MMIFLFIWLILLSPMQYCVAAEETWTPALVLPTSDTSSSLTYPKLDPGATEFNRLFRSSSDYILRRECPQCVASHQVIYYRRITNVDTFDVYSSMLVWESLNNVHTIDFNLYSTFDDVLNDQNAWRFCNYDSSGARTVGAFGDCGVTGSVTDNWCSADETSRECRFSILNAGTRGCTDPIPSNGWQVGNTQIYACKGTIAEGTGGVYGSEAAALCNEPGGYHICESADELSALGLTTALCDTISADNVMFFATKETSDGSFRCHSKPDYIAVDQYMSWDAAQTYCKTQYGTDLATIFDDASAQQLLDFRNAEGLGDVWTGLNDIDSEGEYAWVDGTLCPEVFGYSCAPTSGYAYWMSADNRGGIEHCIFISSSATDIFTLLSDARCTKTMQFICNAAKTTGRDDMWGCTSGQTDADTDVSRECGPLSGIITDDWNYWITPVGYETENAAAVYINDANGGGVLCCAESTCLCLSL